ncbi:MAG: PH domain-containing protein [Candidatus Woesearchaeota archaeon]
MADYHEAKPNKNAFIYYPFIKSIFLALGIFLIILGITFAIIPIMNVITFFILLIIVLIYLYSLNVQYRKQKILFYSDKIIMKGGGIFSDFENELIVKNITHVNLILPYIENKIFRTGSVYIESAGSGRIEISLNSFDRPKEMYEYMMKLMKMNGFKLTQKNLIMQETPNTLGAFFEVFKSFSGIIIFLLYFGAASTSGLNALRNLSPGIQMPILTAIFLILAIIILYLIIRFLDLKKRAYNVYSDTITYTEGFLTKHYSFIPVENLADAELTQTLIDKIFGLYDVKISCQGSGQEILFKNMVNGEKMEKAIDSLISNKRSVIKEDKKSHVPSKIVEKRQAMAAKKSIPNASFSIELTMDRKRTLIPLIVIFFIAIIGAIISLIFTLAGLVAIFYAGLFIGIAFVTNIIRMAFTKFRINKQSVEERFDFITQKNIEFSNDNITGIVVRESIIDMMFNTMNVEFWSIGSSQSIKFRNIKKRPGLLNKIISKLGIEDEKGIYHIGSVFKIMDFFKATLFISFFALLSIILLSISTAMINPLLFLPIILILILYTGIIGYRSIYYKRSKMDFFKTYVYFTRGIFIREKFFVLHDNIKDITTVQYPFSQKGKITFDVSGETLVGQGNNQTLKSNSFAINYADNIIIKDDLIDIIFLKRPSAQQISMIENKPGQYAKDILTEKPMARNTMVPLLIILGTLNIVFLFPIILLFSIVTLNMMIILTFGSALLILDFIIIHLTYLSIRMRSYIIQNYRILSKSGIFYKKQVSIIYGKINHISYTQGILNKMFNNGNVQLFTTGSSNVELNLRDMKEFSQFYSQLKRFY